MNTQLLITFLIKTITTLHTLQTYATKISNEQLNNQLKNYLIKQFENTIVYPVRFKRTRL